VIAAVSPLPGGWLDDGHGRENYLNLILEVSGEARKDKALKVSTARDLWVEAVNNYGGFGRWEFIEISDPWDAANTIRAFVGAGLKPAPTSQGSQ
jgi:type III restriction enzyme